MSIALPSIVVCCLLVGAGTIAGWAMSCVLSCRTVKAALTALSVPSKCGFSLSRLIRELEQHARDNKERYHILTENVAAAVVIHDAEGRITWCSPFSEVLTGYARQEIYAQAPDFLISIAHEEDRERLQRALAIVATGEPFQCTYRLYHRTGIVVWAEARTVPIFEAETNSYMALSIIFDVTSTVLYQRQIEERNRDLHDFTYMVSHDLKAPIFTIKGITELVEEQLPQDQSAQEALTHIRRATDRLDSLVGGVLALAKATGEEQRTETVQLTDVLAELRDDFASLLKNADASLEIADDLPIVSGDRVRLYQVFSNLVGNAIKYRRPDVPLVIRIENEPTRSHRRAAVVIHDNGVGIPEEKLASIFRPFQRVHVGEIEGSGVGLACVERLVTKLGGKVSVTSVVGSGSSFVVDLRRGEV